MADVDFVSENARRMSRQCWRTINHKTLYTRPPGGGAGPAGAALTYLIEYCLISNDQLLGCSLPVPGSGTRNSLVHPVR